MNFIYCKSSTRVIDSRNIDGTIIRYRECTGCGRDFYTQEVSVDYDYGRKLKNKKIHEVKEEQDEHTR